MSWLTSAYLYGFTTLVTAQVMYGYYATQDMGEFYKKPMNMAYEVYSLVPAVCLGILAVCVRETHGAGGDLNVYAKYRVLAAIASIFYTTVLSISALLWLLYCLPYPIHQVAGEFLPSVRHYHHMRLYYFILLQYTPSFFIVAYNKKVTFPLLDAAGGEVESEEKGGL